MSSSEASDASLNDMGSDGEMSPYSSGSELNMDLLTRANSGTVFDPSHKKTSMFPISMDFYFYESFIFMPLPLNCT